MRKKSITGTWLVLLAACIALAALVGFALQNFSIDGGPLDRAAANNPLTGNSSALPTGSETASTNLAANSPAMPSSAGSEQSADKKQGAPQNPQVADTQASGLANADQPNTDQVATQPINVEPLNTKSGISVSDNTASISGQSGETAAKVVDGTAAGPADQNVASASSQQNASDGVEDAKTVLPKLPADAQTAELPQVTTPELPDVQLQLQVADNRLSLSGTLPRSDASSRFGESLRRIEPSMRVTDEITYVEETAGSVAWLAGLGGALKELDAKHSNVQIDIAPDAVRVAGVVTTRQELDRFSALFPSQLDLYGQSGSEVEREFELAVDPLQVGQLVLDLADNTAVATGLINTEQEAQLQRQLAVLQNLDYRVESGKRVSRVAALPSLPELSRAVAESFITGKILLDEKSVEIRGQLDNDDTKVMQEQLRALLPEGVGLVTDLQGRPGLSPEEEEKAEQVQALEQAIASLVFQQGSPELGAGATRVLDQVFETMFLYSDLRVGLRVHSDDTASSVDNLLLSRLRASNMASYLYERGLEQYRVLAVGLADTRPAGADVAGNVTTDSPGTRVELIVMEN